MRKYIYRLKHLVIALGVCFSLISTTFAQDAPRKITPETVAEVEVLTVLGGGELRQLVASPDGAVFAAATSAGVWLFDSATGQQRRFLEGQIGYVMGVAFAPDGLTITTGSSDGMLRTFSVETGLLLNTRMSGSGPIYALALSPDGQTAYAGTMGIMSDTVARIDLATDAPAQLFFASRTLPARAVAVSPDGRWVVAGSDDGMVRTWDAETGEPALTLAGHSAPIYSVAFTPDGQTIVSSGEDSDLRLWDVNSGQLKATFSGHSAPIRSVAVSSDGRRVVTGSNDNTVRVWDIETGDSIHVLQGHIGPVVSVALGVDDTVILAGTMGGWLYRWDAATGILLDEQNPFSNSPGSIWTLEFLPDSHLLALGMADTTLQIWNLDTRTMQRVMVGHLGGVHALAIAPDGQSILSAAYRYTGLDNTLRLWNIASGELIDQIEVPAERIGEVLFLPDGQHAVIEASNRVIYEWEFGQQQLRTLVSDVPSSVGGLAVSPTGELLAIGLFDGSILLWEIHTGQLRHTLVGHTDRVSSVAFTPDGLGLLSGSSDNSLRLWDVRTGESLRIFPGHSGPLAPEVLRLGGDNHAVITDIAIAPDGLTAISGADDGRVQVYEVATGEVLRVLEGHSNIVANVAFAADGTRIGSVGIDGTARIWGLPAE